MRQCAMVQGIQAPSPAGLSDDDIREGSLLSTLHYVYAAFTGVAGLAVGCVGLLPGILMTTAPHDAKGPPPLLLGGLFFALFCFFAAILFVKAG